MASADNPDSQAQQPPCSVALRLSSPTCSISGVSSFSVITVYTCTTSRPIWILVSLFNDFADRVHIRDPNFTDRGGHARRRGCYPTMKCEDFDLRELEFGNSALVKMEPEMKFETSYTLRAKKQQYGYWDTEFMTPGDKYWAELGERKCWWMYADEMDEGLSEQEMREALGKRQSVDWQPDVRAKFTAVE